MRIVGSAGRIAAGLGIALAVAWSLLGCGGGGDVPSPRVQRLSAVGDLGPVFEVRSSTLVPTAEGLPSADELLNWAESAYPELFPGPQSTRSLPPFLYRHYPASGNYLGLADDGAIYVMGRSFGDAGPLRVATLADFACGIKPEGCGEKQVLVGTFGTLERSFIVYTPPRVRGDTGGALVPVVFVVHGTGGNGEKFYATSGWREKADAEGFVAAFPSALPHCFYEDHDGDAALEEDEREITTKWAAGTLGGATRPLCTAAQMADLPADAQVLLDHALPDDMDFFDQMVARVKAVHRADPRRIFATGFSNGAEMTGRLAAERSLVFAAAHSAAGGISVSSVAERPMPVIFSVGALDPNFTTPTGYPDGLPLGPELVSNATFHALVVQPFISSLQLQDVSTHATLTAWDTEISLFSFARPTLRGGTQSLRIAIIAGADHQYPHGSNHPVRLQDALWDFFRANPMPE